MPQAQKKGSQAGEGKAKDKPASNRTNFSKMYPEDAKLKLLVETNPKKKGSKSATRFEGYFGSATVGESLAKGVTYQDIAYDVGRGFIQVG